MRRRAVLGALLTMPFAGGCGSDGPKSPRALRATAPEEHGTPVSVTTVPALGESAAKLRGLEKRFEIRLGIWAVDADSGRSIGHRQDERFAMCSTFKVYAVAAVLRAHPVRTGFLDRRIRFTEADLVPHSPVTQTRVRTGMTVAELCGAALLQSDNTASNELLGLLGGPSAVTEFARSLGDATTRLDDREPELNDVAPGSTRNTTTPAGMAAGYRALLLGDALAPPERERLTRWMRANRTGANRILAGVPEGWTTADKTGTGEYSAVNDVGVVWTPGDSPLVIAVFSDKPVKGSSHEEKPVATATRIAVDALT